MIVGRKSPNPKMATDEAKKAREARYTNGSEKAILTHLVSNFSSPRKAAFLFFLSAINSFSSAFKNHAVSGDVGKVSQQIPPRTKENEPSMMKSQRHAERILVTGLSSVLNRTYLKDHSACPLFGFRRRKVRQMHLQLL
jgi:hypothetical protein